MNTVLFLLALSAFVMLIFGIIPADAKRLDGADDRDMYHPGRWT